MPDNEHESPRASHMVILGVAKLWHERKTEFLGTRLSIDSCIEAKEHFFRVYIASSKHEEGWENLRQLCKRSVEAEWPSGLGRWCCNPEVPRVRGLHPATSGICFSVVPSSNRSRFVNSQLVCLPPVGIFNSVTFIWDICFLCLSGMLVNQLSSQG